MDQLYNRIEYIILRSMFMRKKERMSFKTAVERLSGRRRV